jgi:HEAT repeat protein
MPRLSRLPFTADPALATVVHPARVRSAPVGACGSDPHGLRRALRRLGRPRLLANVAHGEALRATLLAVLATAQDREALAAALAALWHPLDASHARRLLGHPEPMVRVAAARALGRFGGADDFERLSAALGDPSWWVRHRAAQALCALPGIGAAELGALLERLSDRFAADALRQALVDRGAA